MLQKNKRAINSTVVLEILRKAKSVIELVQNAFQIDQKYYAELRCGTNKKCPADAGHMWRSETDEQPISPARNFYGCFSD